MLFYNEDLDSIEQAKYENPITMLTVLNEFSSQSLDDSTFIISVQAFLKPLKYSQFFYPQREGNLLNILADPDAGQLLGICEDEFKKWKPIKTEKDGNCLFNVFATFLLGKHDAEMSKILRVYSTFELIYKIDEYKCNQFCKDYLKHDNLNLDDQLIIAEIIKEAKWCAQLGEWCGFITFIAIANILRRPIRLVYPIRSNNQNIKLAHDHRVMNRMINPTVTEPTAQPIYVLACGNAEGLTERGNESGKEGGKEGGKDWRPNHFVLLIEPN